MCCSRADTRVQHITGTPIHRYTVDRTGMGERDKNPSVDLQPSRGSERRAFASNVVWHALNLVVGYGIALATSIIVARGLGPHRAGIVSFVTWLTDTGSLLGGLGYVRAVERFIAEKQGQARSDLVPPIIRYCLGSIFRLSVLTGLGCTAIAWWSLTRSADWMPGYAPIVMLLVIAGGLWTGVQAASRGFYDFRSLAVAVVFRAASGALVWYVLIRAGAHLLSLFLSGLILTALSATWLARRTGLISLLRAHSTIDATLHTRVRQYAYRVSIVLVADVIVWQRSELFFLSRYASPSAMAFFSIAAGLSMLIARLPQSLTAVIFPVFARRVGQGRENEARRLYEMSTRWVFALSMLLGTGALAFSETLVGKLYGDQFRDAVPLMRILIVAAVIAPLGSPAASYLYTTDRERFYVALAPVSVSINLGLAWGLCATMGATGAAWANMLSQSFVTVTTVLYLWVREGMRVPLGDFLRILTAAVLYYVLCRLISPWGIAGILGGIGLAVLYVFLLFALGVFKRELAQIRGEA